MMLKMAGIKLCEKLTEKLFGVFPHSVVSLLMCSSQVKYMHV